MTRTTAVVLLCLPAFAALAQTPVMFHGNASHTGIYDAAGPIAAGPAKLQLRWKFATAGAIVSSPAIADGVVYVGSADRNLYAVDAATGQLKWKFDAHGDVNSSPAVANGIVYAVSLDGHLYAVDASTGKQRWAFATEGERRFSAPGLFTALPSAETMPDPWDLLLSSPTVAGGSVYFGSGDGYVYAVDARSGQLRWKYKTENVVHASPAVTNGVVYIGSWDTYFYALNASDGRLLWKFKTGDDPRAHLMTGIQGSAAVARGNVYFGCRDGHLYALDAKTGAFRWKYAANGSWVISTPAVKGKVIYFTTSDTEQFIALDAETGKLLYSLPDKIYSFSSPAIAGGEAYFGTFDGKLHAVDLAKRRYSAEFATDGFYANRGKYLDAGGRLRREIVWTGDSLDAMIVDLCGKVFSLGSIVSSPVVAGGTVYVGSVDGNLYALGK